MAATTTVTCDGALADNSGILDAHFTVNTSTGGLSGTVTGGTGSYAGASGSVSGVPVSAGEAITITYSG